MLSQEEISNLFNGSYFGELDNIISYYNFDEGSGNTVYDQSGNGNDERESPVGLPFDDVDIDDV